MNVKVAAGSTLGYCIDCGSEHLRPGCGMTWLQRMGTQTVDTSWMPAKDKKNYYDSESIDDLFGEDSKEQLMEETEGIGACTAAEYQQHKDLQQEISGFYTMDSGE